MLAAIGSILGGGITGVVGSLFSNILNYFNQKQKNNHEVALKKLEMDRDKLNSDLRIAEINANIHQAEVITAGKIEESELEAYKESQRTALIPLLPGNIIEKMLSARGWKAYIAVPIGLIIALLFGAVDFLKHLMRPGITVVMMYVFYQVIVVNAWGSLKASGYEHFFTDEKALEIVMLGVDAAIYLTISCVSWWFSDRQVEKFMIKQRSK